MIRTFAVWIMSFYSMSLLGFLFYFRDNFLQISDEGLLPCSSIFSKSENDTLSNFLE